MTKIVYSTFIKPALCAIKRSYGDPLKTLNGLTIVELIVDAMMRQLQEDYYVVTFDNEGELPCETEKTIAHEEIRRRNLFPKIEEMLRKVVKANYRKIVKALTSELDCDVLVIEVGLDGAIGDFCTN